WLQIGYKATASPAWSRQLPRSTLRSVFIGEHDGQDRLARVPRISEGLEPHQGQGSLEVITADMGSELDRMIPSGRFIAAFHSTLPNRRARITAGIHLSFTKRRGPNGPGIGLLATI